MHSSPPRECIPAAALLRARALIDMQLPNLRFPRMATTQLPTAPLLTLTAAALRVYVNNILKTTQVIPQSGAVTTFNQNLGVMLAGDRVFVAVGPSGDHGNDGASVDFSIRLNSNPVISGVDAASALGAGLSFAGSNVTYNPNASARAQALIAGQVANDTFNYSVSEAGVGTDSAAVAVTVTGVGDFDVDMNLAGGNNSVADDILLTLNALGTMRQVFVNGVLLNEVPVADTHAVNVTGSNDNDRLTIDSTNGNPLPTAGVVFNGGGQTSAVGDRLVLVSGAHGTATYNYTSPIAGSLALSSQGTITFGGLEQITDGGTVISMIVNLPSSGGVQAVLEDDGSSGNGLSTLRSAPVAFVSTNFSNPTTSLTINRGSASDVIVVNALPDFNASVTTNATLLINGSLANGVSDPDVTIQSGGTLGGSGTVNGTVSVQAGGNVAPGPIGGSGILNTGSATIAPSDDLRIDINGATAGSGYDRLNVTGNVTLAGVDLILSGSYIPAFADVFTIVQASGSVSGTFTASEFLFNGIPLETVYTSNSVALRFDSTPVIVAAGVDNVIEVRQDGGGNIEVVIDGVTMLDAPATLLQNVTINGGMGGDSFVVTSPLNLPALILNGEAGNDTFGTMAIKIAPSPTTLMTINGGDPTGVAFPAGDTVGDVLNLDVSSVPLTRPLAVGTIPGQVLATGYMSVDFANIEDINLADGAPATLTSLDMGGLYLRGSDVAAGDMILVSRAPQGTNQNRVLARATPTIAAYTTVMTKVIAYGRDGRDSLNASNLTVPVEFHGEAGDDVLSGSTQNDFLSGGLGNDRINGSSGDNVIWGDDAPTLSQPVPQDAVAGGNDTLSALGGNDVFYGGGGDDSVSAGAGNDYASGGQGNDSLDGSDGDDRLYGGAGNDTLGGSNGNDLLSGGANDDKLYGGSGNDVVLGGMGADLLDGGDGNDLLVSGSVVNENSSWTSVASTSTFAATRYSNPADNDAALLTLLVQWSAASNRTSLGTITHDGANDDLFGSTGDDDFCWETAEVLDNPPGISPPDYNAVGQGNDERFGPM